MAFPRFAAWYERAPHPGLVLAGLIILLYGPSLAGRFVIDDLRNLRLMREYQSRARQSLDLYRFLDGGQANRHQREAGWYPWWMGDELRYRHFRPVSEWSLYSQYLLFGRCPLGYRLVALALYAIGVRLVLGLFRLVSGDERLARWGALLFTLAACHAIPVTFIAAHCDLLALVLSGAALLLIGRFVVDGGTWRILAALTLFAVGLLAKEAVLPLAVLPVGFWLVFRGAPGVGRRTIIAAGSFTLVGLVWLSLYRAGQYGSNAVMMLDPFQAPGDYLLALPGRVVLLLTTWIIPVNPFLFIFHHGWAKWAPVYGAVGVVLLTMLAVMFWRHHRSGRGVSCMTLWVLAFLPLLACTTPDDRVMMLPSIAFAYLAAVWMTRPRGDGSARLRALPVVLFVVLQVPTVLMTSGFMQFMEYEARMHLRLMVQAFGREPQPGDQIFLLNTARNFEALLAQDRLQWMRGNDDIGVSVLSDVSYPEIVLQDQRTLRLEAPDAPLFSTFMGQMGTSRDRPRRVGDVLAAGEVEGRIVELEEGAVRAIELRFRRPLSSDSYRFFWSHWNKPPRMWPMQGLPAED